MSDITNAELRENIKRSLGLSNDLQEAYVAQKKQSDLNTELLSSSAKNSHDELYDGYISTFNQISAELDAVDKEGVNSNSSRFRSLKIDESYNLNAIYLHELYFSNISDLHSEISMDSLSYMRLARDFGTFDDWQKDFIACCMASRCGWAMTVYNTYLQRYVNCVVDLHSSSVPVGSVPIIVMDVWQHAYYRDYVKDVKTYVFAMMKELNWEVIESRFQRAERIAKVLRS